MEDTTPKALEVYLQLHRDMTEGERITRIFELCDFQSALQESSVRMMFPAATEREIFLRIAARRLDRKTMIKVYEWDPDLHP